MFSPRYILLACLPLIFSEASYVHNIPACSLKDFGCMKDTFQKLIHDFGETGIPDINLPPLDPMKLSNININVLEGISLTLKEGVLKGFKNCKVDGFSIDIDKQVAINDVVCDALTLKGHFMIAGTNQLLQGLFGSTSIKGEGKTKIKLEKITVASETPFALVKKEDGEIYFKLLPDKHKYTYDIQKLTFDAKNLLIGKNDLSEIVTNYVNQNWKILLKTYGKQIMDKVMHIAFEFIHIYYDNVDVKKLIKEDLSSYVKN